MEEKIKIKVPGQITGEAELTVYTGESNVYEKRSAVIICPGGGYWQVVAREGEPVARQFVKMGCVAFVLRYSVLPNGFPISLLELAKVVAIVRSRADEWNIDRDKVLLCGFSAGGHLTCSLGVFWNQEFVWRAIGEKNGTVIKPNGMILGYPVITSGIHAHKYFVERLFQYQGGPGEGDVELVSLEKQVSSDTPKAFIWQTCTDEDVPVENSLLLAEAMRKHGLNVELHIFPEGPHGLSLASGLSSMGDAKFENVHCSSWISLVEHWLTLL
jgi:acetyl esterase/lipase